MLIFTSMGSSFVSAHVLNHLFVYARRQLRMCDHGGVFAVLFYRSGGKWCRRAGEGDHLLDGQAEFESVQRVADANLPLDLCV